MSEREKRLNKLAQELEKMTDSPLYSYRQGNGYKPVLGEGNPQATILFIGEAAGAQEARQGRPFVGAAGRILDELLEEIGLSRQDVYITNVVKDRPPENRDPTGEEIKIYKPLLEEQLDIIQPEVIVTLGRFAMDFIFDHYNMPEKGKKIGELHGKLLETKKEKGKVSILPLYHPAVVYYDKEKRTTMKRDIQNLKRFS
jgi:uracil-DNA glycosylase